MEIGHKTVLAGITAVCIAAFTVNGDSSVAHANVPQSSQTAPIAKISQLEEDTRTVDQVKMIGSFTLPYNLTYKGTTVGGLSGITYNPHNHKWLLISDDRSNINPTRFYSAKVNYNSKGFQTVNLTDVTYLKQPDGTVYPNRGEYQSQLQGVVADTESIRFDPLTNNIWYTSEGDRSLGLNPFIRQASLDGSYVSHISVTDTAKINPLAEKGFRNNLALEGSTFSADGQTFWTAMEGPLIQDDTLPNPESGSLTRITQYDRDGNVLAEYAYPLDAIPEEPGKGMHADNAVTEILSINDQELLVLERASVQADDGSYSNYVRIYKISTMGATDISDMESINQEDVTPLNKELIVNLNSLGLDKVDNVEGMTWGKKLPNGNDSLVLVSDNNFNDSQITQFIAFEVFQEDK
ncbi:esterase-like activity of phytase family protein [Virgibacillus kekensis]|uniref:Esterase-like activity of phytase family protein n=1 Tax=Virgibacillus kekensis TaxID=202261 RepID=A0ABV9DMN0_9BACI